MTVGWPCTGRMTWVYGVLDVSDDAVNGSLGQVWVSDRDLMGSVGFLGHMWDIGWPADLLHDPWV
mgnify:FL=1